MLKLCLADRIADRLMFFYQKSNMVGKLSDHLYEVVRIYFDLFGEEEELLPLDEEEWPKLPEDEDGPLRLALAFERCLELPERERDERLQELGRLVELAIKEV